MAMLGFSVNKNGTSFTIEKSMDDNLIASIMDLIFAEEGDPALGYFGGQFKEVAD